MKKLFYTALTTLSFIGITGCDQAPKTPPAAAVSAPPSAPAGSAPLAPLSGGTNLPKFSEWNPSQGVKINAEKETFVVDGDNSSTGYQISSPQIEVKPDSNFIVRVDHTVEAGTVCPGILTGNAGAWIVPASAMTTELRFNSGSNKGIVVVMANCSQQQQGNPKSKFRLKSAVIASANQ